MQHEPIMQHACVLPVCVFCYITSHWLRKPTNAGKWHAIEVSTETDQLGSGDGKRRYQKDKHPRDKLRSDLPGIGFANPPAGHQKRSVLRHLQLSVEVKRCICKRPSKQSRDADESFEDRTSVRVASITSEQGLQAAPTEVARAEQWAISR